MNYHIAARMDRMAPSGIRKVNEKALAMERAGEKVLHFEIGRPDFDTPEYIKEAANQALAQGKVHYTSNFGMMELRQAIADKLKRENHIDYKASEVLVTVGLSEAVFAVLATLLDEGDEILVPDPVWLNYINVPNLLGAKAVTYSLKEENGYQMDLDEIRAKITPRTRAVVIVTPNNPTGGVLERGVLEELAEIVKEHGLMVIADEIYERLVYDGAEHVSIASLPGMKERTFTLNGMSKAYAMDGWRLGYVAAPQVPPAQHHLRPQLCPGGRHRRPHPGGGRGEGDGTGVPAPPGLCGAGHQRHRRHPLPVPQGRLLHLHQLQGAGQVLGGTVPVFPGGGQDRPGARGRVRPRRGGLSAHVLRRQL